MSITVSPFQLIPCLNVFPQQQVWAHQALSVIVVYSWFEAEAIEQQRDTSAGLLLRFLLKNCRTCLQTAAARRTRHEVLKTERVSISGHITGEL